MEHKAFSPALAVMSADENRTVRLRRPANVELRPREYLTDDEVAWLLQAARRRPGRHGLRVSELCALRWEPLEFGRGELHVTRRKGGKPGVHALRGGELDALQRLQREQEPTSPFVFTTERLTPMSPDGFRKLLARVGQAARLPFPVHPHMLRHACGYELRQQNLSARAIQAWLGYADIRPTARFSELSSVPNPLWIVRFSEPEHWRRLASEEQVEFVLTRFPAATTEAIATRLPRSPDAGRRACLPHLLRHWATTRLRSAEIFASALDAKETRKRVRGLRQALLKADTRFRALSDEGLTMLSRELEGANPVDEAYGLLVNFVAI